MTQTQETTVTIRGVEVTIDWSARPTKDAVGVASHTVASSDLDEGCASGPNDGEMIEIDGEKYTLGEHDYSSEDGETTCSASIYRAGMTEAIASAKLDETGTALEAEALMYRFAANYPGWAVVDENGVGIAADSPDRASKTLFLLPPDAPWMADDGNQEIETSASTALGAAEEYVSDGDWGEGKSSVRVHVWREALDYDGETVRVAESSHDVDAGEDPRAVGECGTDDDDHDWEAPLELVGGLRENPGVFSTGGTSFRFESVCVNCGTYRTRTSAGMQRNPGEPSETVEYREADEASLAWVAENA